MELHDNHHLVGYCPPQVMAEPKSEFDPIQGHVQLGQYGPPPSMDTRRALPKFEAQDQHGSGCNMTPSSGAPSGLTHQQAVQRRKQLKAKRRVPASQRKRTKLSCDYCKTRRCKCQRLDQTPSSPMAGNNGDDEGLTPCKLCIEAGIQCVTTMPRKHRIYGSVESLDRRYRAINALIRNLHPQLGAEPTAEEVIAYGRDMGLEIPGNFDDTPSIPATSPQTITRKRPRSVSAAALLSPVSPDTKTARSSDRHKSDKSVKLVRDPSERPQYISSTGSMVFFTRLRNLVATRSKSASSALGGDPYSLAEENVMVTDPTVVYEGYPANAQPLSPSMFRGDSPMTIFSSHDVAQANKSELLRHCVPSSKVKFPEREVADRYIEAFFQHMHPNFVLFHRPTFQHVYEEIWRAATATTTEPGRGVRQSAGADSDANQTYLSGGWLGCLYMIFIFGCRSLPPNNQTLDFQRRYYAEMMELPQLLVTPSLPNVCALMLLSLHSNNSNHRTAAWAYHGAACRLAVALGMHRQDVSGSFHPITRELRKRVWWTLYCYEQNLCCSLDRPSAIDDREVDVNYPDEHVLACDPGQPLGFAEKLAKLWHLIGCIRRDIYDPAHCPASRYHQTVQYLRRLVKWREALPSDLQPTPYTAPPEHRQQHEEEHRTSWRSVMTLHIVYQCALGLLSRRFLLRGVEASQQGLDLGITADGYVVTQLSRVCLTSAMRAVGLFVELWHSDAFNAICWFDVYWADLTSMCLTLRLVAPDTTMPPPHLQSHQQYHHHQHHQRNISTSTAATSDKHSQQGVNSPIVAEESAEHTWKFQPLPTHQQQEAQQSAAAGLGRVLESLLQQHQLVETHGMADLADTVRRLHDILKTVDMSRTNAHFAKAMKLVDGRPTASWEYWG